MEPTIPDPDERDSKEALRASENAVRQAKVSKEVTEILVDEANRSVVAIRELTSSNGYLNRFRTLLGGAR